MSARNSFYDKYFVGVEGRKKAAEQLAQESERLLSNYDPNLVEIVRRRKKAGESLKQIFHDLGENPDILDIGMQLAVLNQSKDIRGGR